MCGRFSLSKKLADLERRFQAKGGEGVETPLFNIAPSHRIPVVTQTYPQEIKLFQWGLLPGQKKEVRGQMPSMVINARVETITSKTLFKPLIQQQRCLILADAYIEWKTVQQVKIPYLVRFEDYRPFAMAGIFDEYTSLEGHLNRQACIVTKSAQPDLADLHDRMPLIVDLVNEKNWLTESIDTLEALEFFTKSVHKGLIRYPIQKEINKDFSNSAALLERRQYQVAVQGNLFI